MFNSVNVGFLIVCENSSKCSSPITARVSTFHMKMDHIYTEHDLIFIASEVLDLHDDSMT